MRILKGNKESREGRLLKGLIYHSFYERGFLTYKELTRLLLNLGIRL